MPTYHQLYFDGILEIVDYLNTSRDNHNHWEKLDGLNNSIEILPSEQYGVSLGAFVSEIRDRSGDAINDSINRIQTIADGIAGDIPHERLPGARVRTHGKTGSAINVQRLLKGNPDMWRRTVHVDRLTQLRVATIVLNVSWTIDNSPDTIEHSLAAALGLASYLEAHGTRCEIWALLLGRRGTTYTNSQATVEYLFSLKRASDPWDISTIAATARAEFIRRVCFRLMEMGQATHGCLTPGYGKPDASYRKHITRMLIDRHIDISTLILAPFCVPDGDNDAVRSIDQAIKWATRQVDTLKSTHNA